MTTVNCSNNEELDFRLIFGEDARQQFSQGPAGQGCDGGAPYITTQSLVSQPAGPELPGLHHPSLPTPASHQAPNSYQNQGYQIQGAQYSPVGYPRAFDCPSIQITSIAPNSHPEAGGCGQEDAPAARGGEGERSDQTWSRDHLYLSLDPCYRDATLNPSPCSSLSSRSWLSDVSSCESFSHIYDDVEAELNEAAARVTLGSPLTSPLPSPGAAAAAFGVELWQQQYQHPLGFAQALSPHQSPRQSPCHSPRHSPRTSVTDENWLNPRPASRPSSRPTSPCGKRRHSSADVHARSPSPHHSPSPTPGHSPRGSVTEDTWVGSLAGALGPLLYGYPELDVPSKTRRTSGTQLALSPGQGDSGLEDLGAVLPFLDSPGDECVNQDGLAELFLSVPSHFSWNQPKPGNAPLFRSSSLPSLDWPLPSQYGQCELKMDVQPRGHHRAHYETEGSRGSIKAVSGGHPVVKLTGYMDQPVNMQVFIGTADDRYLRPHAFYQVHRVTGKTVSTVCQESTIGGTKVLEIPLLPENGMSTSIDCAGILKLRNSDIELRKGETDIGRKNTRVRVVFRVNIPQADGKTLCLQTASIPVECSQRSAQDLPQVERFSPASCPLEGGVKMVISGSSLSPESKVIFVEKGPDGRTQWEVDVKAVPDKSNESSVVVEIPPYHNRKAASAVQVQFYVSNGKRKRSQSQNFTYVTGRTHHFVPAVAAPLVKQEHCDLDYALHNPPGLYQTAATLLTSPDQPFCPNVSYYDSSGLPVARLPSSQPAYSPLGSSPLQYPPQLHGGGPNVGRQGMNPAQMADPSRTLPSSQAAQRPVPYANRSSSPARSASATLANHTASAVPSTMAAPKSAEKLLMYGPIGADLCQRGPPPQAAPGQTRAPVPVQFAPLAYRGSFSPAEPSLSYQRGREAPASYSSSPQASSSVPPRGASAANLGPPRQQGLPLGPRGGAVVIVSSVDRQKHHPPAAPPPPHSLFSGAGDVVRIKQEPEEKRSLGLQEITLDDVNEIIDRDISQLCGGAELVLAGQDHYGWDQNSDGALPFCGGPQ